MNTNSLHAAAVDPPAQRSHASEAADSGLLQRATRTAVRIVEVLACVLVAAEIVLLLCGVVSRYVFRQPLTWSDELASILFLWLAMLGAVLAFCRGEHMRMAALVNGLDEPKRRFFATLAVMVCVAVLLALAWPAIEYAQDEAFISTPTLHLPNIWRAAAMPAGLVLMLAFALLTLLRRERLAHVAGAVVLLAAIAAALWLLRPWLMEIGNYRLLVFFVLLVGAGVFAGAPIGFVFALATVAFLAVTTSTPLSVVVSRMDEGMSHLILLSVPLFVFLGLLIEATGIARSLVSFLAALIGHVRGGLSYVLLGAMFLVSGISGSKAADMAAIAPGLFPEMKKRGVDEGDLVALLSSSGAMSETIPPSLVLITIGSATGVSIAALFTGGILPAVVMALALAVVVGFHCRNDIVDAAPGLLRSAAYWRTVRRTLLLALPGLALPFLIRAAVVEGVTTATEVSTVGIVYALVAGWVINKGLPWRRLGAMLAETAALSGAILLIIGAATAMAWALTQSGFSRDLVAALAGVPGGHYTFLALSIVAFVLLGSVLEGIPAIVLFGPLMFPIAKEIGVHEVHYAMVVVLAMGIGLFMPPFGVGYYTACAIGRISPDRGMKAILPYMGALLAGLLLIALVPWISIGFL
ncbi:TRAP transporter, DctM subunit [Variovorax sp. PDC80]|uniref:TRAP transporter large permease n=1 Tax=Variovorax sp. PDC80 TaxID=1882827 RepID=UPI0008EF09CC|nr:TRAP transporter large permease subunit [Variovorax sp. PDC80]SFO77033.1 TRAP transporter, DctM subunit [Variovorax sp. PDC80]